MTSANEVIDSFTQAMRKHGIETGEAIIADGKLKRFRVTGNKAGDTSGWYILHLDGVPNGVFGCYKRDVNEKWCAKLSRPMTAEEKQALEARKAASKLEQEAEQARIWAKGKTRAESLWASADAAGCIAHPYIVRKGVKAYGIRQLGDAIVVPVRDSAGGMTGLQFIKSDGLKILLKGTKKAGSYHRITGDMTRLLICEGYATGASLHEATGFAVAIAIDAGNLLSVVKALRAKLPDTELVLCAEDDRATSGNVGMTKAQAAALEVDGLLAVPTFSDDSNGTDFNDMHQQSGLEAVRAAIEAAARPEAIENPQHSSILSRHKYAGGAFLVSANGVSFSDGSDTKWLCSKLEISAKTRDAKSGEWGRLLEWADSDGIIHRWAMPMELLQGDGSDIRRELARQGLSIAPSRHARELLAAYLQVWPVESRARCVSKLGWHGGVYLTPNSAIGESNEKVVFQNAHSIEPGFSVSGTLGEWRDSVGMLSAGNSRMVFALSVAFAGSLAAVAGEDSGGFHFRGPSSCGKSTGLKLAASVWGHPDTYRRLWRATANGLEGLAALHNDGILILDELSQCDSREAGEAAYMLANGQGKARASRSGTARAPATWRTLFLSAGEVSLTTLMASNGKKANAGQEIRLADIAADAGADMGAFESLHGLTSPSALADVLSVASNKYHGAAGMEWLRMVVLDRAKLPDLITEGIGQFVREVVPVGASGQVMRVARRFALVAFAGELASQYGITGWRESEAIEAAAKCFSSWLEGFGGIGNREQQQMRAQVRGFFEAHGASRFENSNGSHDQRIANRVGFIRESNNGREFLVMPEAFKVEICKGLDPKEVAAELIAIGWLKHEGRHHTVKTTVAGLPSSRYYVFTPQLWEDAA
ncbi:DUF927 domain-containing protein [Paraperlucidibaca sp.]|uniref:DUF927 domain-containing protein n=1 Tax=Paraperlucidibaca sp. TaxID=2708021 RepID=UPI0030F3D210